MLKITNLCCIIVAVCINFQNADAGRFLPSFNPLDSLLNAPGQISNALLGDKDQKPIKDAVKPNLNIPFPSSPNTIEALLKAAQIDISACTNLCNEGRKVFDELISNVDTCIVQSGNTEGLKDIKNNLENIREIVTDKIQDSQECFKTFSPLKPKPTVTCLSEVWNNNDELKSAMQEAMSKSSEFMTNLLKCLRTTCLNFFEKNSDKLIKSMGQCYQNIFEIFHKFQKLIPI